MSKAVVCDRCGDQVRPFEAFCIGVRRFEIWHDLDMCLKCKREFEKLYHDWMAAGREKR